MTLASPQLPAATNSNSSSSTLRQITIYIYIYRPSGKVVVAVAYLVCSKTKTKTRKKTPRKTTALLGKTRKRKPAKTRAPACLPVCPSCPIPFRLISLGIDNRKLRGSPWTHLKGPQDNLDPKVVELFPQEARHDRRRVSREGKVVQARPLGLRRRERFSLCHANRAEQGGADRQHTRLIPTGRADSGMMKQTHSTTTTTTKRQQRQKQEQEQQRQQQQAQLQPKVRKITPHLLETRQFAWTRRTFCPFKRKPILPGSQTRRTGTHHTRAPKRRTTFADLSTMARIARKSSRSPTAGSKKRRLIS